MSTITINTPTAELSATGRELRDAVEGVAAELRHVQAWASRGIPVPVGIDGSDPDEPGFDMLAWFESFLDWDYLTDRHGDIVQHELLVTVGGPNVWVEVTARGNATVKGAWGHERAEAHAAADAIEEFLTDLADAERS